MTLGVILAGGQSRRMGQAKHMLPFGTGTLLDHITDRLMPHCARLVVNAQDPIPNYETHRDAVAGSWGPLAGILTGMQVARDLGYDDILTVATDTPFFPDDLGAQLRAARSDAGAKIAIAATQTGPHPTVGLWATDLAPRLYDSLHRGDRRVMQWAKDHGAITVMFETGSVDPFFNINTPQDYEAALRHLTELE